MTIVAGIVFIVAGWALMSFMITKKGAHAKAPFDTSKVMWSALFYAKKQGMLSFITLASGVFILFTVGLNRQGFSDSSQIRTATGGFSLWCETSVPVYHNIQTSEGRAKMALTELHGDVHPIQLLKYSNDDASCLNLNKVVTPNVLGIDFDELAASDFVLSKTIFGDFDTKEGGRNKYSGEAMRNASTDGIFPALVDETVLTWSLGKKLGDTLYYIGDRGRTIPIVLAGTIQNSIFQGYILIDKTLFSQIWSEISGSEVMLIRAPQEAVADTKALISQALNNYGVRIMTTAERLQLFYSVIDTYLTIFLTLGGLGLLLGIFSFIIVVKKNLLARMKEVMLYRSLGFDRKRIADLLCKENITIPLCAILTGASGAICGVGAGIGNVGIKIWLLSSIFLIIFIFCVIRFVKISVNLNLKWR